MKTFKEFTDTLRQELWPAGEHIPLKTAHTKFFMGAMTDLQTNVPCLQKFNATSFSKCSRYWEDGATVVDAPYGIISRVYSIANGEWRDKVWFWPSNYVEVQRWQKRLFDAVTPANTGLPSLPQGYRFDDGTVDWAHGRARVGIWCIHRHRLYIAPWLQSNESLIVEWDGVKDIWADGDGVNETYWTVEVQEAIKLYVKWKHEFHYGDISISGALKNAYETHRANCMQNCWDRTKEQERHEIPEAGIFLQKSTIDDDAVPAAQSTDFVICGIADWGDDNANTDAVIAQIKLINPGIVFTAGDNVYSGNDPAALFAKFGSLTVKPTWGNHDWDYGSGDLSELKALFELPNNERYYEVVNGNVHHFILDSDQREPDGGYVDATTSTQNSIMGEWLRVRLALSTAKWKFVWAHHAPYTSDASYTPGIRYMRWPFKTWGADLVLSGHAHNSEHILGSDGMNYFTLGNGGKDLRAFGAPTAGTIKKQYNSDYGFLKIATNCDQAVISMINKSGESVYSATLTKS